MIETNLPSLELNAFMVPSLLDEIIKFSSLLKQIDFTDYSCEFIFNIGAFPIFKKFSVK